MQANWRQKLIIHVAMLYNIKYAHAVSSTAGLDQPPERLPWSELQALRTKKASTGPSSQLTYVIECKHTLYFSLQHALGLLDCRHDSSARGEEESGKSNTQTGNSPPPRWVLSDQQNEG